jgi:hypothetical protein
MRSKLFVILSLTLFLCSAAIAQKKAVIVGPDTVVKNLYAAHNGKNGPFFQNKSRARIDLYFTKELGNMIWKDIVETEPGTVGALDFDPLYSAQDVHISRFKIKKPMYGEGNMDIADVEVTFRNMSTNETVLFRLERAKNKKWLIDNISYPSNGSSLREVYTLNNQPSGSKN